MKTNTKNRILEILKKEQSSVSVIAETLDISTQMVHRHLKSLLGENIVVKNGTPPKVFYRLNKEYEKAIIKYSLDDNVEKIIDENFLYITPSGEKNSGSRGFTLWCLERGFNIEKKADEYLKIFNKYNKIKKSGLINGTEKIANTFEMKCIDEVYYIDFYAWEIFGKTKLGQFTLYAKQNQSKKMIREIAETVKDKITNFIKKEKIEAIGFVQPTVKREVQFMKELEKALNIKLPKIKITKIKTEISVPQKSLSRLKDRIMNADSTFVIESDVDYKRVLLIDDAVGSGATLNQVACKIKRKSKKVKVFGLVVVGSLKGFEIISEV